ncbi:IclR family transcriptional regulator [Clostridiaceae bacterium UIB06]|uniref:Glycerol operon regulatory protein n=1 Tax=Clostridium thailandense TaxID=2794346 RepID=A0A949TJZ1_9CLOT|nr:IclR family transcriptional regulator [Clostridium thailandense]MBV7273690.1 IclR family transcriptional regulator [Clostridium thailandense]MCH5137082.1 IclR family transcriptional regulator [Clostridiaceae bacterium UIB06]
MVSERKNINSVVKSLKILECFSREVKELKLTEISKMLEMPKSTTSNLIYTLLDMGYIEQNNENGKFSLGAKLFILGKVFEHHLNMVEIAKPYMETLRNKFNESVHLSISYNNAGICIEKIEGFNAIGMNSQVGKTLPLHCTASGKLILSGMSEEKLETTLKNIDLFKRTEATITDVDIIRREINLIKEKGYSIAVEEGEIGLTSIAAPIYNYKGELIACLSIAGPSARIDGNVRDEIVQELLKISKEVSAKLGYM